MNDSPDTPATPSAAFRTSGLMLDLTTVLGIISRAEPIIAAAPAFKDLLEAVLSTFSITEQSQLVTAYDQKIAESDHSHEDTQAVLAEKAGEAG